MHIVFKIIALVIHTVMIVAMAVAFGKSLATEANGLLVIGTVMMIVSGICILTTETEG